MGRDAEFVADSLRDVEPVQILCFVNVYVFIFRCFVKFTIQYLTLTSVVADKWWDSKNKGPIFLYTGNEGDIIEFWNNSGFLFEIAPQFGALVLFAEHVRQFMQHI